ncbi:MAG: hypothetical protein K0R51_1559 [Cytophagaceae bacterium]|nr:hypothetical protein [Cytophagaceae bacterium]
MSRPSLINAAKNCVAISVSESADSTYSNESMQSFVIDVVTNLLLTGKRVAYGGDLRNGGFSELMADAGYRQRGFSKEKAMIDQYLVYPLHKQVTAELVSSYKDSRVQLIKTDVENKENKSYLWSRALTRMRAQMAINTNARVIMGGKTMDYLGKMPGVMEEAKLTLKSDKPLYLIGCFEGAASQIIQAIEGHGFTYQDNHFHSTHDYIQFKYTYNQENQHQKISPQQDAQFFKDYGLERLSKNNGLTPEENRILFYTKNPSEALFHLFKGLRKVSTKK